MKKVANLFGHVPEKQYLCTTKQKNTIMPYEIKDKRLRAALDKRGMTDIHLIRDIGFFFVKNDRYGFAGCIEARNFKALTTSQWTEKITNFVPKPYVRD